MSSSPPQGPPRMAPARVRVPAHVAAYSLLLLPAVGFWLYYERNAPTEDEIAATLKKHGYHKTDDKTQQRSQDMRDFFQRSVFNEQGRLDETTQAQIDELLKGGVGDMTRQAAVDETLLGTKEGQTEKERVTAELQRQEQERSQRRKEKQQQKTKTDVGESSNNKSDKVKQESKKDTESSFSSTEAQQRQQKGRLLSSDSARIAALVGVVGSVAALVGFLAGSSGGRR